MTVSVICSEKTYSVITDRGLELPVVAADVELVSPLDGVPAMELAALSDAELEPLAVVAPSLEAEADESEDGVTAEAEPEEPVPEAASVPDADPSVEAPEPPVKPFCCANC
jgi:hypothetical protein